MAASDMKKECKVACIVPTRNGGNDLRALFSSLKNQKQSFDLYVVDSESTDDSVEQAYSAGADVLKIPAEEFDHGGTRQLIINKLVGYDVCVFLTQDAELATPYSLAKLVEPFQDRNVGATYGRQLPKENATPFAAFLRHFNYPGHSIRQSLASIPFLGMKTVFLSNSFAAYRRRALQEVGGFPEKVILGEDVYAAACLVSAGWEVAYIADAECFHSHNYSIFQEWRRYFDIGVFHSDESWILERFGSVGGEGRRFVIEELRYLSSEHKNLLLASLIRNAGKFISYQLGKRERFLPCWVKRRLAMHSKYWN